MMKLHYMPFFYNVNKKSCTGVIIVNKIMFSLQMIGGIMKSLNNRICQEQMKMFQIHANDG